MHKKSKSSMRKTKRAEEKPLSESELEHVAGGTLAAVPTPDDGVAMEDEARKKRAAGTGGANIAGAWNLISNKTAL